MIEQKKVHALAVSIRTNKDLYKLVQWFATRKRLPTRIEKGYAYTGAGISDAKLKPTLRVLATILDPHVVYQIRRGEGRLSYLWIRCTGPDLIKACSDALNWADEERGYFMAADAAMDEIIVEDALNIDGDGSPLDGASPASAFALADAMAAVRKHMRSLLITRLTIEA